MPGPVQLISVVSFPGDTTVPPVTVQVYVLPGVEGLMMYVPMEFTQMVSGPVIVIGTGEGLITTLRLDVLPWHPKKLYSVTETVPLPAAPQLTVMALKPCPPAMAPPVTVHV